MAEGQQNSGNRGWDGGGDPAVPGANPGEYDQHGAGGAPPERAEPVENLIKPRKQDAGSPLVARREARNVKRAGIGDERGAGAAGRLMWVLVALLTAGLVSTAVVGAKRIGDLEAQLAEVEGVTGGDEGGNAGVSGELAVLTERLRGLEENLAAFEAKGAAVEGGGGADDEVLSRLATRADLAALADEAIAMGFRSVLRKLDSAVGEGADEEIIRAANAEKARVEIYFLNGASFFPLPLPEEQDGMPVQEIGTDRLAEYLLVRESPGPLRARAAQLLGRRMEVLSADALSESLVLEPDLRVLVHATASFRRVTGCPIPSVFGGPEMRDWLSGNRALVVERFKDIAAKQAAARQK